MINESRPTTLLANSAKVSIGETWDSIITTWATETRTWEAVSKLITNVSAGVIGLLWSIKRFPWTELTPWLSEGGITNQLKP